MQKEITVPDIGDFKNVEIIEVLVKPGDSIQAETPLITLESDKAAIEVPSPFAGVVHTLHVKVGDRVSRGSPVLMLELAEAGAPAAVPSPSAVAEAAIPAAPTLAATPPAPPAAEPVAQTLPAPLAAAGEQSLPSHASPAIRKFARELGADLSRIAGTGPKGRILKEDVQRYIKESLARPVTAVSAGGGFALPPAPEIDFARYGEIERKPLSRIQKLSGANLHRSWISIPHVTYQEEADITDLEAFRQSLKAEADKRGVKFTFLPFVLKAVAAALKQFPAFNASLAANGEELIFKRYLHMGVAVDTPDGLVVPVLRDVDKKSLFELAAELGEVSQRARGKKLRNTDLEGGCFTITSLGGIGGTGFTPIINPPEVAILGLSKAQTKPVWQDGQFVPRLMLPLSLSFDHRVIDGAQAARFAAYLSAALADLRRVLL